MLYRFGLLLSTIFLAYGAFAIIYYAREQITWSDRTFGTFLAQLVEGVISEDSQQIKEFTKHPPHFKKEGAFFRSAKLFTVFGVVIYGLLFVYGMFQSICFGTSFFENM